MLWSIRYGIYRALTGHRGTGSRREDREKPPCYCHEFHDVGDIDFRTRWMN